MNIKILFTLFMFLPAAHAGAQFHDFHEYINQDSLIRKHKVKSIQLNDVREGEDMEFLDILDYDNKGQLTRISKRYIIDWDTSWDYTLFVYSKGRLVKQIRTSDSDENPGKVDTSFVRYIYGKDGLLQKTISSSSYSRKTSTTQYSYSFVSGSVASKKATSQGFISIDSFTYYDNGDLKSVDAYMPGSLSIDVNDSSCDMDRETFDYSFGRLARVHSSGVQSASGYESPKNTTYYFYDEKGLLSMIQFSAWRRGKEGVALRTTQQTLHYEFY